MPSLYRLHDTVSSVLYNSWKWRSCLLSTEKRALFPYRIQFRPLIKSLIVAGGYTLLSSPLRTDTTIYIRHWYHDWKANLGGGSLPRIYSKQPTPCLPECFVVQHQELLKLSEGYVGGANCDSGKEWLTDGSLASFICLHGFSRVPIFSELIFSSRFSIMALASSPNNSSKSIVSISMQR